MKELILMQNRHFLVVNKPAAVAVQPDKTDETCLIEQLEGYCKTKLHLIHRLDRPASGVIIFGKTHQSLTSLNRQFQEHTVRKKYLAVVKEHPPKDSDTLVHYLRKNQGKNETAAYDMEVKNSKRAEMTYEVIRSIENYHLLEINLITGRHHQIRAQLAAIGCPIKGDVKYGFRRNNEDRSIHLHAWQLAFDHPSTEERLHVSAPLPDEVVWNAFFENDSEEAEEAFD